jgi:hypothetical protein
MRGRTPTTYADPSGREGIAEGAERIAEVSEPAATAREAAGEEISGGIESAAEDMAEPVDAAPDPEPTAPEAGDTGVGGSGEAGGGGSGDIGEPPGEGPGAEGTDGGGSADNPANLGRSYGGGGSADNPANLGRSYGGGGTVVRDPGLQVESVDPHAALRMAQRGLSLADVRSIVSEPIVVLLQAGSRYLYLSALGGAVLTPSGLVVSAWSYADMSSTNLKIISEALGQS